MAHVTVTELRQTEAGGIYLVAEVRHDASDPTPYYTEDFTWNVVPRSRPRPITDDRGRIKLKNGQWKWPRNANPQQIDYAPFDPAESLDAILETVLKHAEGKAKVPPINGRMLQQPPAAAAATSTEFDSLAAQVPPGLTDTHDAVVRRRRDRRRGLPV